MSGTTSLPGTTPGTQSPRVLGFDSDSTVDVRAVGDTNWETLLPLTYHGKVDDIVVPSHATTDFASVPRVFVWFLPRYGRYTKAAILHDHLWQVAVPSEHISRLDADGMFRQAMRELGVPFLRRWIMWAAVRWGALTKRDARADWLKEAWQVLLVTVIALPFVAPAAAVILVTLPVFYLFELIAWVPLRLAYALKTRRQQSTKTTNMPVLGWKLDR